MSSLLLVDSLAVCVERWATKFSIAQGHWQLGVSNTQRVYLERIVDVSWLLFLSDDWCGCRDSLLLLLLVLTLLLAAKDFLTRGLAPR